jgi:hypothetical protein
MKGCSLAGERVTRDSERAGLRMRPDKRRSMRVALLDPQET